MVESAGAPPVPAHRDKSSTDSPFGVRVDLICRRKVLRLVTQCGRFANVSQVIVLGDAAAILAFGSIAFLGIVGSFVLDAKKARQHVEAWRAYAAATSNVPFLAIIRGRQRLAVGEIGPWRIHREGTNRRTQSRRTLAA
jgi:hypothetical protein